MVKGTAHQNQALVSQSQFFNSPRQKAPWLLALSTLTYSMKEGAYASPARMK